MVDIRSRHHAIHHRAGPRLSADERRDDIIRAAIAEFAVGGYAGTSTEAIARRVGVSQPYLFRLFGTKQGLFIAVIDRMYERIRLTFEEAAKHPDPLEGDWYNPVLRSMGMAYGELVGDSNLLRLQLQAFAACYDPVIARTVREGFAALTQQVAHLSGVPVAELRPFFAEGMLMNVAAAMGLDDAHVAWTTICEGGPA